MGDFYFLLLHRHLQVAQLVWASEPIEFGSAFVSIYGKASSCALFLTSRNQVNQNLEKWNRQVSGSKGHGDRYIGSLFGVDEPVPDDSSPMILLPLSI